jgi:hypothetical protein
MIARLIAMGHARFASVRRRKGDPPALELGDVGGILPIFPEPQR